MNIETTSFGGLLLHTSHGNFAVNAGGSVDEMAIRYRLREQPLRGLILTAEHINRARNAAEFANRFRIPVLVSMVTWAVLREHFDRPVLVSPPCTADFEGLSVEFHFVSYDSSDPVYLIVRDQENAVGIVPDGKLTGRTAEPLRQCNALCLPRRPLLLPGPPALKRRLLSVTNTAEEIDRLFPDIVPVFL